MQIFFFKYKYDKKNISLNVNGDFFKYKDIWQYSPNRVLVREILNFTETTIVPIYATITFGYLESKLHN